MGVTNAQRRPLDVTRTVLTEAIGLILWPVLDLRAFLAGAFAVRIDVVVDEQREGRKILHSVTLRINATGVYAAPYP